MKGYLSTNVGKKLALDELIKQNDTKIRQELFYNFGGSYRLFCREDIFDYLVHNNPRFFNQGDIWRLLVLKEIPKNIDRYFRWCQENHFNFWFPTLALNVFWKRVHQCDKLEFKVYMISLLLILNRDYTYKIDKIVAAANRNGTLDEILKPFIVFNCQDAKIKKYIAKRPFQCLRYEIIPGDLENLPLQVLTIVNQQTYLLIDELRKNR